MFYFDKHNPNVLFQNVRRISTTLCGGRTFEVNPDLFAACIDLIERLVEQGYINTKKQLQ